MCFLLFNEGCTLKLPRYGGNKSRLRSIACGDALQKNLQGKTSVGVINISAFNVLAFFMRVMLSN